MVHQVERNKLSELNKRLDHAAKSLDRMCTFHKSGVMIDYSLNDAYNDIFDIGASLNEIQKNDDFDLNEIEVLAARQRDLLAEFESLLDDFNLQSKGMVLVSRRTIPDFFYKITGRCQKMWRFFEYISAASGLAIILFALISITYYSAYGSLPFIQMASVVSPLVQGFGFIFGLIIGLIVHEFAHGIVLANNGIKIKEIGAMAGSMVGGFIEADEETFFQSDQNVHLRFNASSIGTNALFALVLILVAAVITSDFIMYLALGNLFFGVINSFPVRPLDGGWVYEDIAKIYLKNKILKQTFLSLRYLIVILWLVLFSYSAITFH